MKSILRGLPVLVLLSGASVPALAAVNDFRTLFAKHWQISKEFTLAVAEAMPAEYYDFKPNPEEMSFGEMMSHLAQSNAEAFASVAEIEPPPVPSGYDKKTVLKSLNDSFDWCAKQFGAMTSAQFDRMLNISEGRQATGIEVLCWAFTDTAHHRGQAEVYMRVKGIKPPHYRF